MMFKLLASNNHQMLWKWEPPTGYFSTREHEATAWFYEQKSVRVQHLGSGRDFVWVNPAQVVFMERDDG
jgi:hypothetical protein